MKKLLLAAILGCCVSICCTAQYYLRGEVHDELGKSLSNVRIYLFSKGTYPFSTGASGTFGIPVSVKQDSILLQLEGYEPLKKMVESNKFQSFTLKTTQVGASFTKYKLASFTKNLFKENYHQRNNFNESYNILVENEFVDAKKFTETGFALNTDRASYSNIRRFLNMDERVPPDAVRIEEMLNYFHFEDSSHSSAANDFTCKTTLTNAPWNNNNQLLFIKLQAPKINTENVPPANLIFLIDVSGSMDKPNRLPLVQSGLKLLVENLRDKDSVAIVVYGGAVGIILQPTSGADKKKINDALDRLSPGGDTPGEAAIRTAYALAGRSFNRNGNNRVILATDGDFNVGEASEAALEKLVAQQQQTGIYLTCLGLGMGNYKDSKLEALAKKGNGNFAYIDNIHEAEKVLIEEFAKTIYTVADDAFVNVQFNPAMVKQYKLIGYDNRNDAIDSDSNELEGGSVGSGHTVMAVFEIVPANNLADTIIITRQPIATLKLQYKKDINSAFTFREFNAPYHAIDINNTSSCEKLATSIIMFGSMLKQSSFAKDYSWDSVLKFANNCYNRENYADTELVSLIEKAKKIYNVKNRKKNKQF